MYCLQLSNGKRNKPRLLLILLALAATLAALTGCFSEPEKPDPPPEKTTPEPVYLPNQPLPVPGWLGFGTIPAKDMPRNFPWSPINSEGQVATFYQDWSEVEEGTPLLAIGPGFQQEVRFLRWAEQPYGCEEIPTPMATFTSSTSVPEGPIWLLPPGAANTATGIPLEELSLDAVPESLLPEKKRQPTKALAWKAGETIILLEKKNEDKARLTVAVSEEPVFSAEAEHSILEGVYHEPVDFSIPFQPGIPKPVGVFKFGADSMPSIVLWRPSFEGNRFELLAQTPEGMQSVELDSIYFCAF